MTTTGLPPARMDSVCLLYSGWSGDDTIDVILHQPLKQRSMLLSMHRMMCPRVSQRKLLLTIERWCSYVTSVGKTIIDEELKIGNAIIVTMNNGENKNRYTCTGCMRKYIHDNTQWTMENNSSLLEILTQYEVLISYRNKLLDLGPII